MRNHLMVVIHAVSEGQALRNAKLAFESGADGIFLINHDIEAQKLTDLYKLIRDSLGKDKFVGVNFLGTGGPLAATDLLATLPLPSALWLDSVGYVDPERGHEMESVSVAKRIKRKVALHHPDALVFGGLAFKYQRQPQDLQLATRLLAPFVDVLTTSGAETGVAPELEKIQQIHQAALGNPIAVASGMTPYNVDPFLPYVTYFLVATGVSRSHTELDGVEVRKFSSKMQRS